ncbi:carbon storage regulator CsrA [Ruminococcaceae bacterium OttesenSCG-928-I18]|nr:carbon storage regulator CsrA [Ruminococcaceae bacterium OttesenSCG-928-I18]
MLILTRKAGQGFTIGEDVEITITEISGDKVRVGINAPKEIKILRSELTQTVEQNVQAAGPASSEAIRALAMGLKADGGLGKQKEKPAQGGLTKDKTER